MQRAGVDRLAAPHLASTWCAGAAPVSLADVYGAMVDPLPMMVLFDKLRMAGRGHVRDRAGPARRSAAGVRQLPGKKDGTVKVLLKP
jgi:hypothetical protein